MSEFNDLLTSWRRDLHQHPEYALTETYTPAFIAQRLREMGVEFEEHVGKTGIVATIKNGTGKKVVGLRADFDGILLQEQNTFSYCSKNDGLMHGCGHDGHTASLLGAVKRSRKTRISTAPSALCSSRARSPERGARAMIEDGIFERFPMDEIYGLHNAPRSRGGHARHLRRRPLLERRQF